MGDLRPAGEKGNFVALEEIQSQYKNALYFL